MRKGLLFSFVFWASLLLQAVAQNEPTQSSAIPDPSTIIAESGLINYFHFRNDRTWRDLDVFYLNGVEKYQDRSDLFNFRSAAIQGLIDFYKLLDDNGIEATERIGFYAEEMASLKNCNPEVLYPMLVRMQGYWEPSKISQVAAVGYKNATSLFNVMKKDNPSYEARKIGMENLKSLFAVKK